MKKITRREIIPMLGAAVAGGALLSLQSNTKSDNVSPDNRFAKKSHSKTQPKALKPGDIVGICAPAGALKRREEVQEFQDIIKRLGYKTKVAQNIYKREGYLAGSDTDRASDFMSLIEDDTVKAIFFIRGGWGCARILPLLDFNSIARHPKIIMGFSDATSLLNAITSRSLIVTFHGPSGNSSWNPYSVKYIQRLLREGQMFTYENSTEDAPIRTYIPGEAMGELIGGNLTVFTSLLGTQHLPRLTNTLLFLEEVDEEPYSVDRMLTQLHQADVFKQVNGVILGNFRKCTAEEPQRSLTLEEVFEHHFSGYDKPVFYGAQIGHTRNKFTIPIGVDAIMNSNEGSIQLLSPAVRV